MKTPDVQSIQGLTPSGSVTLNETFAAGYGGGSGTLTFNGQTYPFKLVGVVVGPGGAERLAASGEVYKLPKVADFAGRYTKMWLENNAGVIMHLSSQTHGMLLSLGKEEIVIHLNQ